MLGRFWRRASPDWRRIRLWLVVIGPGIITANVDNDAGGITTYSLAGAQFGYAFLWTLIPITVALILVQEMCARMGVVTGKGLSDLIRERFGVRWAFYSLLALVIANFGNILAEFSGVAAALEIFGISKFVSVPLGAAFVWWLAIKGSYRSVEKVFLVACVFYVSYLISGLMATPRWGDVLQATVVPTWSFQAAYLSMFLGVVGTTIAPWMQYYIQSSIADKKLRAETYAITRWDVVVGCIITDVVAFFIILACAETIYRHGLQIETAKDAALALGPLAGPWAAWLFAFGLFNAGLFAASVLPLSTAYAICEGLGWEAGLNFGFKEAPAFYGIYTGLIALGAGLVLLPGAPLLGIMFWSQVVNGVLLPFVLIFMLLLINNRRLMGRHVNGLGLNLLSWSVVAVLITCTVLLVVSFLWPNLFGAH